MSQDKFIWEKLPKPMNAFTVRSAMMADLKTGDIIRHYLANTRITVTEKCVTEHGTYYRTESASLHSLDWAFEASAFGLPNECAPSVPGLTPPNSVKPVVSKKTGAKKQKSTQKTPTPKDGEEKEPSKKGFWKRIFRK